MKHWFAILAHEFVFAVHEQYWFGNVVRRMKQWFAIWLKNLSLQVMSNIG
jgi:hypothetical protein